MGRVEAASTLRRTSTKPGYSDSADLVAEREARQLIVQQGVRS